MDHRTGLSDAVTAPVPQAIIVGAANAIAWLGDLDHLTKLLGIILVLIYMAVQITTWRVRRVELAEAKERLKQAREAGDE
jgi:hypothetical protein